MAKHTKNAGHTPAGKAGMPYALQRHHHGLHLAHPGHGGRVAFAPPDGHHLHPANLLIRQISRQARGRLYMNLRQPPYQIHKEKLG